MCCVGAAAADEWAASAAEGSVGGGWGVHPDGQRAILLELLTQPRRAERLLVALTPDAAAAFVKQMTADGRLVQELWS